MEPETVRLLAWAAFDVVVLFVIFRFLFLKLRSKMAEVEARKQARWTTENGNESE